MEATTTHPASTRHNRALWLYKLRAMLISLGISVVCISLLSFCLLQYWYPEWFLFRYDGGWQGLRIVMGVDLILGPTLAFVIFNPTKSRRSMLIDVGIIATIQLSAFVWGCYALWSQHPLALSYRDDKFLSIIRNDLTIQKATADVLSPFAVNQLIFIYSEPGKTTQERMDEVVESFTLGLSAYARVISYRPFKEHLADIFVNQSLRREALEKDQPGALAEFAKSHNKESNSLLLVPASLRYGIVVLLFESDKLLGAIPVSNWFNAKPAEKKVSKKGAKKKRHLTPTPSGASKP